MKCPSCGKWNRASLPKCFYCGCELDENRINPENAGENWQKKLEHSSPAKVYIQVDDEGNSSAATDDRESIAREMKSLRKRQMQGREAQEKIRIAGAEQGYVPSSRRVRTSNVPVTYPEIAGRAVHLENADAVPEQRKNENVLYDDLQGINYYSGTAMPYAEPPESMMKVKHRVSSVRLLRVIAYVLIILAVLTAVGYFVYNRVAGSIEAPLQERVVITASMMDDMAAHTILIPGEEGQRIWIREMKQDYEVIGGYATVQISDSNWYSKEEGETKEKVDVTLNPYLRTKAGEQKKMGEIHYTVDVPLAPLILITPDDYYAETNSETYTIKFKVDRNSTVYINGENYTSFVNSQEDGLVSFNATIRANGINEFNIVTNCQYYRQNEVLLQIYRAPVSIEVHLDTTMSDRSSKQTMAISGTTLAGSNLIVLSPYQNLNLSKMASVGEFSFDAVFETIGNNDIQIQVSYPGMETTVYTKSIYYLPGAKEYSQKAWSLNRAYDYSDYLNLTELRVAKTQVYVCKGTLTEILSDSPQLAIMELDGTADGNGGSPRTVLLENRSTDTWVIGSHYDIYGDAYGTYNSMPRLIARYTYER